MAQMKIDDTNKIKNYVWEYILIQTLVYVANTPVISKFRRTQHHLCSSY